MLNKTMGVINITPNSFSDGNQFLDYQNFKNKFTEVLAWADIVDIGAESTAPFNDPVSLDEELDRYEASLFKLLEEIEDPLCALSVDTYKPVVFKTVAKKVYEKWPQTKLIFNDVSGCLDDELLKLLGEFNIPFTYVFSHNLAPIRSETQNHMDYVKNSLSDEYLNEFINYFIKGIQKLNETNTPFYIDPCFGFSKSREQNHFLLKNLKTFLLQIPFEIPLLYGVSRKSFLRFPKDLDPKLKQNQVLLDHIQTGLIFDLISSGQNRDIIFRLHDYAPLEAAIRVKEILK